MLRFSSRLGSDGRASDSTGAALIDLPADGSRPKVVPRHLPTRPRASTLPSTTVLAMWSSDDVRALPPVLLLLCHLGLLDFWAESSCSSVTEPWKADDSAGRCEDGERGVHEREPPDPKSLRVPDGERAGV